MSEWTIYYNPRCGTCQKTLALLKSKKIEPRVVDYLKTPPSPTELKGIAAKLGARWTEMVRTKEPIYEQLRLGQGEPSRNDLLKAVAEHPALLQRPIVVRGERAVVARPPGKVAELF